MTLADSFRVVITKIMAASSIWVGDPNGWYHSFDKKEVADRIKEIKSEIIRLEARND